MAYPSRPIIIAAIVSVAMFLPGIRSPAGATATGSALQITGRVLLADGSAASDAGVRLYPILSPFTRARMLLESVTVEPVARTEVDDDGWFSINAPHAGLWAVHVEAPGFVAMEYRLLPLTEHTQLVEVELPLDRDLKVKIKDSDDRPIRGATVKLERIDSPGAWARDFAMWRSAPRDGTTGLAGTVTLPRGENEDLILTATAPGYPLYALERVRETAASITLAHQAVREIEVFSADDVPAAGILVAGGKTVHPLGITDDKGRFSIPCSAAQPLELTVLSPDGGSTRTRLKAADGDEAQPHRVVLRPSVTLSGRVIDRLTRRPLAGAIIWPKDAPWDGVTSDTAGRFALDRPGSRPADLEAGFTGYLRSQPLRADPAEAGRQPTVLALTPAAAVAGMAVDGDGAPVAGARVSLRVMRAGRDRLYFPNPWESLPASQTDARGRFRLSPVDPSHDYFVTAQREPFAAADASILGLEPHLTRSDVRLVLMAGQEVTGLVLDAEENPLAGASVTLVPSSRQRSGLPGNWRMLETGGPVDGTSDVDGRFVIRGVPIGPHDVTVRHEGFATQHSARHQVADSAAPHDLGIFRMLPGATLRGRLVHHHDLPVAGAEIRVNRGEPIIIDPRNHTQAWKPDATSGPDGWFAIDDLRPGSRIDLRISRSGYVTLTAPGVFTPQIEPLILTMQEAVRVAGSVVDADGDPVAGADVALIRRREGGSGNSMYWHNETQIAVTDSEGLFLIENIEPGRVTMTASADGYQQTRLEGVEVPRDEPLEDLTLTLNRGATVIGSVTTADRQPCIGAWVKILPTQANRPLETGPPARTDGAGKYRLEGLTPGPLSIEATLTGHTRAVRETDLHLGVNELDLVLGDGQTVAGMVTDQSGAPIPNASVQLRSPGQNWSMLFAESGQDGTFVIEGVEDGEFIPTARADGFAPYTHDGRIHIAGESRTGLTIRMQPAVSISGRVTGVDPVDYPLVRLNVTGPGAWYNGIGIDHEGGYRIDNLTRGDYRVTASLEGRGTQVSRSVTIDAGVREAHLDLEFGEGLALGGRALIGTAPVRGASVFITGASGRQAGWGRTDSTGSFRIGGLEPATYTLQLRQFETGLVYAEEVLLEASRDIEVRVPVTRLRGHLIDAATFQPLQGVRADLEPVAYGEEHSTAYFMSRTATSDSSGQFSIDNLSSGTWTLSLSRAGYAARSLEIQLTDEHQDDLKIELSPTEGLVLNIRLASGRYPDFVRIAALDGSGRAIVQGRFSTGEQGKVHLASLPPGNWELLLATGGAATTRIDVTTPAGPLSLSLEPPTGLEISLPDLDPDAPPATLTIVDASGHPFRSIDWDGSPRSHWSIGSDGSEFQTLPAGTWTIRVEDTEGSTWERNVATAPGSIARIDLR